MQDKLEFYKKLKVQLDDTNKWPNEYLYKFIVPSSGDGVEQVSSSFDKLGAVISTRKSKTGKYTSISIRVVMKSSDAIIQKYRDCENIEGLLSL